MFVHFIVKIFHFALYILLKFLGPFKVRMHFSFSSKFYEIYFQCVPKLCNIMLKLIFLIIFFLYIKIKNENEKLLHGLTQTHDTNAISKLFGQL